MTHLKTQVERFQYRAEVLLIRDTIYLRASHEAQKLVILGTLYDWNAAGGPAPLDMLCSEADPGYTLATPEQHS